MAATWFRRQFGLAIALCYAGWHFGGLALAPLAQFLIDHEGWRSTALIMGALIFLIGLPPLIAWARIPSPAALGLVIDGETGPSTAYEPALPTLMQAPAYSGEPASLSRLTFWLAVAVTVLGGIAYGGLLAHEVSLISDRPVAHALGALALGLTAGFAVVGAISVGHLSDRWPYRLTMSLELGIMLLSVLGFLLFLRTSSIVVLLASAITFGLSVGGFDTCIVSNLRKQVGTERFSAVYGRWYFFYLVTLFVGPILIGAVYDAFGSYQFGLYLMVACIAGAMIAVIATPFNRAAATYAAIN
jgi:MFS family permease